ncbi:MAG: KTSC domain-containing protein [Burkholderiales bacterium]
MERKRVSSSNIRSIGYDEKTRTLEVEFNNGGVYQYANVSPEVHGRFLSASSIGSFFKDSIEEDYSCKRIR